MDATRDYHTKSERQILYDITYMWNLKYDTNEPIYKTETESQTQRRDSWLLKGREEGQTGSLGLVDANYRMNKQGATVQHRERYPIFWDKP